MKLENLFENSTLPTVAEAKAWAEANFHRYVVDDLQFDADPTYGVVITPKRSITLTEAALLEVSTDVYEVPYKFGTSVKSFEVCLNFKSSRMKNTLKSFKNFPDKVKSSLDVSFCGLTSLEGCPSTDGDCVLNGNNFTSIEGLPKSCEALYLNGNKKLTSISNINKHTQCKQLILDPRYTKEGYLSILKIQGLREVDLTMALRADEKNSSAAERAHFAQLEQIINDQLAGDRDILDCQELMLDAGFEEFASL